MDEPPRDNCNMSLFTLLSLAYMLCIGNDYSVKRGKSIQFISSTKLNRIIGVMRNIHSPRLLTALRS